MTAIALDQRLVENLFVGAILLWGVYVLAESFTYDNFLAWSFPVMVAVPMVVLCVLKIAHNVTSHEVLDRFIYHDVSTEDRAGSLSELAIVSAAMAVYIALIITVGFFLAMPVFLFLFFRGFGLYSTPKAVGLTIVVWLSIAFLFGSVFNVSGVFLGPFSEFDVGLFN